MIYHFKKMIIFIFLLIEYAFKVKYIKNLKKEKYILYFCINLNEYYDKSNQ